MANPAWKISGDYFEACSCDAVCPCPTSGLAARPTQGSCDAGLVFHVERGSYGPTTLDGLSFAVLLHTPGPSRSRACSISPSRASRARARRSRSTSTTSRIPPRPASRSRKHRGATCTRSGSTGTTRRARTTGTSPRFRGVRASRRTVQGRFPHSRTSPQRADLAKGIVTANQLWRCWLGLMRAVNIPLRISAIMRPLVRTVSVRPVRR